MISFSGKSQEEKIELKSDLIVTSFPEKKEVEQLVTPKELQIEIVNINKIDKGVEVFAKAWRNGTRIGFGKDGSVEIERFRIFNPPIYVPDENGEYVREWDDDQGNHFIHRFREDPIEALLQVIEQNISVMKNVHDDSRIVEGKIGNTTSTFYPAAGANSPVDGYAFYDPTATTWALLHDFTGAATGADTTATTLTAMVQRGNASSGYKQIQRSHILFDTSTIPDGDTISSATISLFGTASGFQDALPAAGVNIYESTLPATNTVTVNDYDAFEGATSAATPLSTAKDLTTISQSAYEAFVLNATGIALINKTGISKFALRESTYDGANVAPGLGSGEFSRWQPSSADQAGTTQDPMLVVEHSGAVDTLLASSVSSVSFSKKVSVHAY